METPKKNFKKRTAILSFLRQTKDHPSAEMVFNHLKQEIPDLSLGTVNAVERFDRNVEPHVHFICNGCDAFTDLPQIQVPEELNQQVIKETGGTVNVCNLTFNGYCRDCKEKQNGITA